MLHRRVASQGRNIIPVAMDSTIDNMEISATYSLYAVQYGACGVAATLILLFWTVLEAVHTGLCRRALRKRVY